MSHAINHSFVPRRVRLAGAGDAAVAAPGGFAAPASMPAITLTLPDTAVRDMAADQEPGTANEPAADERTSWSFASLAALPVLAVYLVTLYLRPQDWVSAVQGWPVDWVLFAALLLLVPFRLRRLQSHVCRSVPFWILVAWLGVIILSNAVHGEFWQVKSSLFTYGRFVVVFVDILLFVESDRQLRFMVWVMVALTGVLGWQAIDMIRDGIGWAGQPLGWNDGFGGRAQWVGLWDGPDVFCLLFVVATPFLIEFALHPGRWITRVIAASLVPLMVYAIYLTQSRGGFVALAAGMMIWAFSRFTLRRGILLAVVAGLALLAVAPGRMGKLDDRDTHRSAYNRVEMWGASFAMLRGNPVLGVGKMRFAEFGKEETGRAMLAHNTFVENMGETGLVGLFVFLALYYASMKGLFQRIAAERDPHARSLAIALLVSLCSFVTASLFVTTEFDLLYLQLALAAAFLAGPGRTVRLSWKDVPILGAIQVVFIIGMYVFVRMYL